MKANRKAARNEPAATMAPVTEILGTVAEELRQAALRIDQMPVCTEHLKERMSAEDSNYLRAIQSLDHSAQKLAGLADFLSALADRAPPHWLLDTHIAAQVVTLAELAERLRLSESKSEAAAASDGDCEFF